MIPLREKFEGCLFGLAVGDALGFTVEFSSMEAIRARFGAFGIQELVTRDGVAQVSDDTQMSLAVAHGLCRSGRGATVETSAPFIAEEFVAWASNPPGGHRAPGNACMAGCAALARGVPWERAGGGAEANKGGCGSVMRSAPYGLYFLHDEDQAIACASRPDDPRRSACCRR
jgi:ADP-ribosylglycohydrolase